jgi:uncharacterized membrane protein YidH (DUF202 family)
LILMKTRTLVATLLIALGIMAFVYQGIRYKTQQEALDLGPPQVTTQTTRTLPVPPIVGALALVSGLVLLFVGNSRQRIPAYAERD